MAVPSDKWTYVFDPGANLVPSLGPYASAIEQAIILATPNANRGMVIWNASVPQVTGQPTGYPTNWYAFQARCLWIDPDGNARYYNGSVWNHVVARPGVNSISNTMVVNGTLTISKFSSSGGSSGNIIRVAALGGFEFVTPIAAINANELPINRIFSPASGTQLFRSINGVKDWATFDSALIVGALADNVVGVNKLLRGAALQVPMVAADGNSVAWTSVLTGVADGSIGLSKLVNSVGDAGKYLKYDATGKVIAADSGVLGTNAALANSDKIVAITTAGTIKNATFGKYDSGLVALVAGTATYDGLHGLGVTPSIAQAYLECIADEHGYVAGDRIDLSYVYGEFGSDQRTALQLSVNTTKWTLVLVNNAIATLTGIRIYVRTTGAQQDINPARWRLRVILHAF